MQAAAAFERAYLERARAAVGKAGAARLWLAATDAPADAIAPWWVEPGTGLAAAMLPNPWDDRAAIECMDAWCWDVAQRVCARCAEALDERTGSSHEADWWARVLAPWMVHLTSATADRRLLARTALELGLPVAAGGRGRHGPPATMTQGISELMEAERACEMTAGLVEALGGEVQLLPRGTPDRLVAGTASRDLLLQQLPRDPRRAVSAVRRRAGRVGAEWWLRRRGRRVAVVGLSGFGGADLLRLGRRVEGLQHVGFVACPDVPPSDPALRLPFPCDAGDELERMVTAALPDALPRSVLEGFAQISGAACRGYGSPLPVVACNYAADEVQNVFLADCAAAGHPVIHAQHGGYYLQAAVNPQERLEIREGSEFWSWGGRGPGIVPTPTPRLERIRDSARGGTCVALIEHLHPPATQVIRFGSKPLGNQAFDGPRRLATFVEAVHPQTRRHVRLKRFPAPTGPGVRPPALEALPDTGPPGALTATEWMQRARIAVVSYPDTPFLEALVIGCPTIGLWNPEHWEWRREARDVLVALQRARMVFADPLEAAAHVDAVMAAPTRWWGAADVVSARGLFLDRFAARGDWLAAWADGLRRVLA